MSHQLSVRQLERQSSMDLMCAGLPDRWCAVVSPWSNLCRRGSCVRSRRFCIIQGVDWHHVRWKLPLKDKASCLARRQEVWQQLRSQWPNWFQAWARTGHPGLGEGKRGMNHQCTHTAVLVFYWTTSGSAQAIQWSAQAIHWSNVHRAWRAPAWARSGSCTSHQLLAMASPDYTRDIWLLNLRACCTDASEYKSQSLRHAGDRGASGIIPGGATLIFDTELVSING